MTSGFESVFLLLGNTFMKRNIKLREFSYHIVGSFELDESHLSLHDLWGIFLAQLNLLTLSYRLRVRAFILMGSHFHLLASTHVEDSSWICRGLKEGVNRMTGKTLLEEVSAFEIKHPIYFQYAYKYIYRNPVSAGLCSKIEAYPFSSIHNILGKKEENFLLFDNMNLVHDPVRMLKWLNEPIQYPPELEELNRLFT